MSFWKDNDAPFTVLTFYSFSARDGQGHIYKSWDCYSVPGSNTHERILRHVQVSGHALAFTLFILCYCLDSDTFHTFTYFLFFSVLQEAPEFQRAVLFSYIAGHYAYILCRVVARNSGFCALNFLWGPLKMGGCKITFLSNLYMDK